MSSKNSLPSDSDTYEFSAEIQRKIIAMMLCDTALFVRARPIVKPEYFDNPIHKDIIKLILDFSEKYSRAPSETELADELHRVTVNDVTHQSYVDEISRVLSSAIDVGSEETIDFRYVADKISAFAKFQSVRQAIVDSPKLLLRGNYEAILERVRAAMHVGDDNLDIGSMYFEETEQRLAHRRDGLNRYDIAIKTSIRSLDRALGGGIAPGELGVLMGPMKKGKTMASVNFAVGALLDGKHVFHYIMESNEMRLQVLYDACIAGVDKDNLKSHEDEVRQKVNEFHTSMANGRLVVKHFPALTCSAWSIESHIQNVKALHNLEPNLIIIDYLGLMRAADKGFRNDGSSEGRYLMFGQITKELLSLGQRTGAATWLLQQTKRPKEGQVLFDMGDSADSIEPMRDADIILTLNQTAEEEERGALRIFLAGGREIRDRQTIRLSINKAKCQITDLDPDPGAV